MGLIQDVFRLLLYRFRFFPMTVLNRAYFIPKVVQREEMIIDRVLSDESRCWYYNQCRFHLFLYSHSTGMPPKLDPQPITFQIQSGFSPIWQNLELETFRPAADK